MGVHFAVKSELGLGTSRAASMQCSPGTDPCTTPSYTIPTLIAETFIFVPTHTKKKMHNGLEVIFSLNAALKSKNLKAQIRASRHNPGSV